MYREKCEEESLPHLQPHAGMPLLATIPAFPSFTSPHTPQIAIDRIDNCQGRRNTHEGEGKLLRLQELVDALQSLVNVNLIYEHFSNLEC